MRLLRLEISNFAPLRLFGFRMPVMQIVRDCFVFALPRSYNRPIKPHHSMYQSDVKLKPITSWSLTFSRASGRSRFHALQAIQLVYLCSYCVLKVYSFLLIGRSNYYSFGQFLRELIKKRSSPHIINRDYSIFLRLSPAHLKRPSN